MENMSCGWSCAERRVGETYLVCFRTRKTFGRQMGRSDEMLFFPLKPDAFTALRPDRGVYEYHSVGDESVFGDELTG